MDENKEDEPIYRVNNIDIEEIAKEWMKEFKLEETELSEEQMSEIINILKINSE